MLLQLNIRYISSIYPWFKLSRVSYSYFIFSIVDLYMQIAYSDWIVWTILGPHHYWYHCHENTNKLFFQCIISNIVKYFQLLDFSIFFFLTAYNKSVENWVLMWFFITLPSYSTAPLLCKVNSQPSLKSNIQWTQCSHRIHWIKMLNFL